MYVEPQPKYLVNESETQNLLKGAGPDTLPGELASLALPRPSDLGWSVGPPQTLAGRV